MMMRRWIRIGAATVLAVGATLALSVAPAQARPARCNSDLEMIQHAWDMYDYYASWAGINRHDNDWQDYQENMNEAASWAGIARMYEGLAEHEGC
jgi:hypothetical protein